jgi:gluconate 2-dehydrogenase alpha chain
MKAIVIGSGPGGAVAAMTLAEAGLDVVVLEKGPNSYGDLRAENPSTSWSNDDLKRSRFYCKPDPLTEPRTYRWSASETEPRFTGLVQALAQTVGGGAVHWGADTPRFWNIDFSKLSLLGPVTGADIIDWPFDYAEIAPFYSEIEKLIGVAGDVSALPDVVLKHAPRTGPLPMPAGPGQYSSLLAARGCSAFGLHPFPVPMAINSVAYGGRPACNNCGFCNDYGCPINARIGALAPLRRAVLAGAEVRPLSCATAIRTKGSKATAVQWERAGATHTESADLVVLAGNAIESSRLVALSRLPDPHSTAGRYLMFHWFSDGSGIFLDQVPGAQVGRSITHDCDDFADPDYPGARAAAKAAGLPYFRGGGLELGGSQQGILIDEANTYRSLLPVASPAKPFGVAFKELMRSSILRNRLVGVSMMSEDLPYRTNTVDLDPKVKDYRGQPVARITYQPGPHEIAAQNFYLPRIAQILRLAGAQKVAAVSAASSPHTLVAGGNVPTTQHVMGGLRMGEDATLSSTDPMGRYHQLDNLFVADGSVFPSSGAHNPTLTIMATALRNSRRWI